MREWLPISTSPKGRLALTAVREFGARPYEQVTVGDLAAGAGVTTGAIYHHFQSKHGLYVFVRRDVERRLLDRMEGAAAATGREGRATAVTSAMLVGFDYAVAQQLPGLLGEHPEDQGDDLLVELLSRLTEPAPAPLGRILAAAWRAAVQAVADGSAPEPVRGALLSLHVGPDESVSPG